MFHRLLAGLFPTWWDSSAGRELRAAKARDAAFLSFQKLLKDGGYNETPKFRASAKTVDQPARDTQDAPSVNPTGNKASADGPGPRPDKTA